MEYCCAHEKSKLAYSRVREAVMTIVLKEMRELLAGDDGDGGLVE